jgi:hypothetical protein
LRQVHQFILATSQLSDKAESVLKFGLRGEFLEDRLWGRWGFDDDVFHNLFDFGLRNPSCRRFDFLIRLLLLRIGIDNLLWREPARLVARGRRHDEDVQVCSRRVEEG